MSESELTVAARRPWVTRERIEEAFNLVEQVLAVLNQLPEEDSPPLVKTTSLRLSILDNLAYIVGGFTFLLALLLQFVGDPLLPYVGAGVAVIVIGGIGTAWWGSWRSALVRRKVHG